MPVNREVIGSVGWRKSLKHQSKIILSQLAGVDYLDRNNYTKDDLIEIYFQKILRVDE